MQKNGYNVICPVCKKSFYTIPSLVIRGRGKYCSASCRSKVVVYSMLKVRGDSWRQKAKENMARLHKQQNTKEENHPRWKGDFVGYFGVHDWITKHYGQPKYCEICGLDDPKRMYHWANITYLYKRNIVDWKRMCVSCHRKYDYANSRKNKKLETTR